MGSLKSTHSLLFLILTPTNWNVCGALCQLKDLFFQERDKSRQSVSLSASANARDYEIGFFGIHADGQGWLVYRNNVGGTRVS